MLFTDVHATWTKSLYAGMNAAAAAMATKLATGMKPTAAHAAKASSRVILTPRIPLQT
jgi:hypothetical protein